MTTELRAVEARPARSQWPIALGSGVLVALVLLVGQRVMGSPAKASLSTTPVVTSPNAMVVTTPVVAAPAPAPVPEPAKTEVAKVEPVPALVPLVPLVPAAKVQAKAPVAEKRASNLLPRMEVTPAAETVATNTTATVPMVPRAELEREVARLHAEQKELTDLRAQLDGSQRELADARARIAAMPRPPQQPIATDRDQILQTLAPVLKTATGQP
jgi:hypothetical protein